MDDPAPNPVDKWIGMHAITENISMRLRRLKELSFHKWRIVLSNGGSKESYIYWEEPGEIEMKLFFNFNSIENCREPRMIKLAYELVFEALAVVWLVKGFNLDWLSKIHSEIVKDDYKVAARYGKDFPSPDKRHKAAIYCELYPDYSDCYVVFTGKKKAPLRRIKFLKGDIDPEFFLGFFTDRYWPDNDHFIISDTRKEIFYVFNIYNDEFIIDYKEVYDTADVLKNFLKAFQYGVPYEEKRRILGLR